MALRVARGLFRLWLILSVLWIGGVGVVFWNTLPHTQDEFVQATARVGLIPPAFLLALGSALVWAFRGFR